MRDPDKNTLLLIADISGFTRFINETEINHSSHIISELLELVIDENQLDLKIAEIEGDAVFFYKTGRSPDVEEIIDQAKKMFTAFHEQLKRYERDRICQCGACVTASKLGLKFVTHKGNVLFHDIQGRLQLMGKEVTLVHKLLKNNIVESNYFLFTDRFESVDDNLFINERNSYDGLGEVIFKYLSFENIKNDISSAPNTKKRKLRVENPMIITASIEAPMLRIHANLIDLKKRPLWKTDVKYDDKLIERVGTSHECILPKGTVIGHVIDNEVNGDEILYEEYTDRKNILFPAISEVYHLTSLTPNSTMLSIEIHIHTNLFIRFLINLLFKSVLQKGIQRFTELNENKKGKSIKTGVDLTGILKNTN